MGTGFVSLGALSFAKGHLEDAKSGLLLNSACQIIGSLISILLGFAFLAIALLFIATLIKEEKAPRKVERARASRSSPTERSNIYRAAHSRHGDWSGPGVAFGKHEAPRKAPIAPPLRASSGLSPTPGWEHLATGSSHASGHLTPQHAGTEAASGEIV